MTQISHVRRERRYANAAWCGETLNRTTWAFLGWEHAIAAAEQNSLIEICPQCAAIGISLLKSFITP